MAFPTLDELQWSYSRSLHQAGRKEEAGKLALETIESTEKTVAELEALPKDDPKKRRLEMVRRSLNSRYQSIAPMLAETGDYQKALDFIGQAEQASGEHLLEDRPRLESLRAEVYSKMSKPDLEMESYARSFAARMDVKVRDKIVEAAAKAGKSAEDIFEKARRIRKESVTPMKGFELKTAEGPMASLDSLRSKVTLVNFFFPT